MKYRVIVHATVVDADKIREALGGNQNWEMVSPVIRGGEELIEFRVEEKFLNDLLIKLKKVHPQEEPAVEHEI
jgi:hypothetical protein